MVFLIIGLLASFLVAIGIAVFTEKVKRGTPAAAGRPMQKVTGRGGQLD